MNFEDKFGKILLYFNIAIIIIKIWLKIIKNIIKYNNNYTLYIKKFCVFSID